MDIGDKETHRLGKRVEIILWERRYGISRQEKWISNIKYENQKEKGGEICWWKRRYDVRDL